MIPNEECYILFKKNRLVLSVNGAKLYFKNYTKFISFIRHIKLNIFIKNRINYVFNIGLDYVLKHNVF